MTDEAPPSIPPASAIPESGSPPVSSGSATGKQPRKRRFFLRMAGIGASAQAAIPGLYAWALTVAPAAWSRGGPILAKAAAAIGVVALITAPVIEGMAPPEPAEKAAGPGRRRLGLRLASLSGPTWARAWSIWGFVLSSAIVWALAPAALSAARLDAVRGALGMVGWALFAFASAGPALKPEPGFAGRIIASTSLKPRSALPRGDGTDARVGLVLALAMQLVGWGVTAPERAVLVRLVTVVCGIAVVGGTTTIALARHTKRVPASSRIKLRRSLPWIVMLALFVGAGAAVGMLR